jgi:hypothetical protein
VGKHSVAVLRPITGSSWYMGRVGVLAVALGVVRRFPVVR